MIVTDFNGIQSNQNDAFWSDHNFRRTFFILVSLFTLEINNFITWVICSLNRCRKWFIKINIGTNRRYIEVNMVLNTFKSRTIFISHLIFIIFLILTTKLWASEGNDRDQIVISADSIRSSYKAYLYLRGIEQEKQNKIKPLKVIKDVSLFLPKQFYQWSKYASGYGAKLINDPKFTDNIEDFFYTDNKKFGWYPLLSMTSGFRPRVGVNVSFRQDNFQTVLKAKYADESKYYGEMRFAYSLKTGDQTLRFTMRGFTQSDDDLVYYGKGHIPEQDDRNEFLNQKKHNYGIFQQRMNGFQLISGIRVFENLEFFVSNLYQQRHLSDGEDGENRIASSFDLTKIPGIGQQKTSFYNELLMRYDSRGIRKSFSDGLLVESSIGYSRGMNGNRADFVKTSLTVLRGIPILRDNRILIPRIKFNRIDSEDTVDFIDYPANMDYRGVNIRKLIRIDKYSLIPSIEYEWPLSFNLGGHIFYDRLLVAEQLNQFTFHRAPWAIGFGVDFHSIDGELARLQIATGSEELYISADIGWSLIF